MPSSDKYAATAWSMDRYIDLKFPSGQLAQVRRPGVPQLVAMGILDSADSLGALIAQKHIKRVRGSAQVDAASLLKDPANLLTIMQLVDRITAYMIIQPKVENVAIEFEDDEGKKKWRNRTEDEREEGVVYTDAIEITDRMFLFQFAVGGSTDLATFRERFATALGSMEAQPDVQVSPK